jgi:hypothetical protein
LVAAFVDPLMSVAAFAFCVGGSFWVSPIIGVRIARTATGSISRTIVNWLFFWPQLALAPNGLATHALSGHPNLFSAPTVKIGVAVFWVLVVTGFVAGCGRRTIALRLVAALPVAIAAVSLAYVALGFADITAVLVGP